MQDISKKSVGTLIDELITTDLKCWYAQEKVMNETDPVKLAEAAKDAQRFNLRRNLLIRAIDEALGQENSQLPKTYA